MAPLLKAEKKVTTLPKAHLGYFHKEYAVNGIRIRGHKNVDDLAFFEAERRMKRLLKHLPQVWQQLSRLKAEIHLIAEKDSLTKIPRYRLTQASKSRDGTTAGEWTRAISDLHSALSEEGLLLSKSFRFDDKRDIFTHEFSHAIMDYGIPLKVREKIRSHYLKTKKKGLWPGCYSMSNEMEFFAETTMWYFGTNGDSGKIRPKPQAGAQWLKKYDPETYKFLDLFWSGKLTMTYKPTEIEWPLIPPAKYIKGAKSAGNNSNRTRMIFTNQSKKQYFIYWIDFKGNKRMKVPLDPGMNFGYSSYKGHLIGLADKTGKLIKTVRVPTLNSKVVISPAQ